MKPRRSIREELRWATVRGIREYGHLAVGIALVGGPVTLYLVIVGITATTAVQTTLSLLAMVVSAVLAKRRRRAS